MRTIAVAVAILSAVSQQAESKEEKKHGAFPDSRLITAAHGVQLNSWANQTGGLDQKWKLCYSSFTMSKTSPAEFHRRCDEYKPTVTVAHNSGGRQGKCDGVRPGPKGESWPCSPIDPKTSCNGHCSSDASACTGSINTNRSGSPCGPSNPGNFIFGGFADASWGGGVWAGTKACFIFGLGPGKPERFGPIGNHQEFQSLNPDYWPAWGRSGDLFMGVGGPPGSGGYCRQGDTYAGSPKQICGTDDRDGTEWGETQLEVWRLADAPAQPERTLV